MRQRIVVADSSPHARLALRLLLEQLPGVADVAEATTSDACLATLEHAAADVLLLDWRLPGAASDHLLARLRCAHPGLRIVALSSRPEDGPRALAAGAHAFVSKADAPEALLASLPLAD